MAVADVLDALTSKRPYKEAWSMEKAFEYIEAESGKHFDPNLVALTVSIRKNIEKISNRQGSHLH